MVLGSIWSLCTMKTSNSIPELSKLIQLRPFAGVALHVGSPHQHPISLGSNSCWNDQLPHPRFGRSSRIELDRDCSILCQVAAPTLAARYPSQSARVQIMVVSQPILTTILFLCSLRSRSNCKTHQQNGTLSSQIEPMYPQFQPNHMTTNHKHLPPKQCRQNQNLFVPHQICNLFVPHQICVLPFSLL